VTETIEWIAGILLPIALVAGAARAVVVRNETRYNNARRTVRRLDLWLTKRTQLITAHDRAFAVFCRLLGTFDARSVKDIGRMLVGRIGAGIYGLGIIWLRIKALPGKYRDEDRPRRFQCARKFMKIREADHESHLKADLALLKETLKTGVTYHSLLERHGNLAVWGAVTAIVATVMVWAAESQGSEKIEYGVVFLSPIVILGVVTVLDGDILLKKYWEGSDSKATERAVLFAWGCAIPVFLGLRTLEFSPLALEFDDLIDAQQVSGLFIGVAVILTLCKCLTLKKQQGSVTREEDEYIQESRRLYSWPWPRQTPLRFRERQRFWMLGVFGLYVVSVVAFVAPVIQGVNWRCTTGGGMALLATTTSVLAAPGILLARAGELRRAGTVICAVLAVGPLAAIIHMRNGAEHRIGVNACGEGGAEAVAIVGVDTTVIARGLSGYDRDILEEPVFFNAGSAELTTMAVATLDEKAIVLRESPGVEFRIEGHADERGPKAYNQRLGEERAQRVLEFLRTAVELDSVSATSYGEVRPSSAGLGRSAWAVNRRVEFVIVKEPPMEGIVVSSDSLTVIVTDTLMVSDTARGAAGTG